MSPPLSAVPLYAAMAVSAAMAGEAWWSASNERSLLQRGAVIVADASYPWMRIAYPLGFLLVVAEGCWRDAPWSRWATLGLAIWLAGKAIKYAAMFTLGRRWGFRVLVRPGETLVADGIYAIVRHPNYVGVAGEVIGIALWMQAPITGTLFAVTFGLILLWRIRIEERALGLAPRS